MIYKIHGKGLMDIEFCPIDDSIGICVYDNNAETETFIEIERKDFDEMLKLMELSNDDIKRISI